MIEQPYQSIGSFAISAFVGRMMNEQYPADRPYFEQDLTPQALFDETMTPEEKRAIRDQLHVEDMIVMLTLESAGNNLDNGPSGMGFYATKQRSLTQLAVTGDTCERLNPDFSITVFRRDQYVVQRDGEQRVVRVITEEDIDPVSLSDSMLAKASLSRSELEDADFEGRRKALYTSSHWDYAKKKWKVRQEIDGKEIYSDWHKYNPYTVTALDLATVDSYGRGLIESAFGDLSSYNTFCQHMIDYGGMSSKLVPCIDQNSNTRPEDLARASGVPIVTSVKDGVVKDIAFLQVSKGNDMAVVQAVMQKIEERLGRSLLLKSESVRNSERTTAYEVQTVTLQQNAEAMAGMFAAIADQMDAPQIRHAIWMAREKGILPKRSNTVLEGIRVNLLTGQAALASQARTARAAALVQAATQLGDAAMRYIDQGVLFRMIARMQRIDEPGLIKSEAVVAQETQAAMQQQLALEAGQQAIATSGAIAENAAAAAMQPKG